MLTLLDLSLPFNMTVWSVFMVVIVAWITRISGVLEKHATGTMPNGLDEVDGKVRVVLKALAVGIDIALATRIHDLACSNPRHKLSEWGLRRALAVDIIDLLGVRHQLSFIQAFAILIHGNVLQLWHVETVSTLR